MLNYKSIFDCIDYLLDMGFHENTYIVNILESPDHLNILNLPEFMIDQIKLTLQEKIKQYNSSYALHNSLSMMLSRLEQPCIKNTKPLLHYLAELDQRRQLDSRSIFPELYSML